MPKSQSSIFHRSSWNHFIIPKQECNLCATCKDLGNVRREHLFDFHSRGTYTTSVCSVHTNLHINIQWLQRKQAKLKSCLDSFPALMFCCWENCWVWLWAWQWSVKLIKATTKVLELSNTNRATPKASCQLQQEQIWRVTIPGICQVCPQWRANTLPAPALPSPLQSSHHVPGEISQSKNHSSL